MIVICLLTLGGDDIFMPNNIKKKLNFCRKHKYYKLKHNFLKIHSNISLDNCMIYLISLNFEYIITCFVGAFMSLK